MDKMKGITETNNLLAFAGHSPAQSEIESPGAAPAGASGKVLA